MAKFIRNVLKSMATLLVAYVLLGLTLLLLLGIVGSLLQPEPFKVKEGSLLVLDTGFVLRDTPASDDPAVILRNALSGESAEVLSLQQVLSGIEEAQDDPNIRGILLTGRFQSAPYANSLASLRELRNHLTKFQKSGKKVYSYLDNEGLREYYVKSVADTVYANNFMTLDFRGLGGEVLYWGEFLKSIGIEYQIARVGSFKSAGERYAQGEMSDAERLQVMVLLEDVWLQIREDIASKREITIGKLQTVADTSPWLNAEDGLEAGMFDRLVTYDELLEEMEKVSGYDPEIESFKQVAFVDYIEPEPSEAMMAEVLPGNKVGVVYLEGPIVDGEGEFDNAARGGGRPDGPVSP